MDIRAVADELQPCYSAPAWRCTTVAVKQQTAAEQQLHRQQGGEPHLARAVGATQAVAAAALEPEARVGQQDLATCMSSAAEISTGANSTGANQCPLDRSAERATLQALASSYTEAAAHRRPG